MKPGDLLTVNQAATRLTISRRKVYQLIQSGKLAAHRFEGVYRVKLSAIDAYVERTTVVVPKSAKEAIASVKRPRPSVGCPVPITGRYLS